MLEVAISIATGTPAFGTAAVPEPGPVVYVIEESGRRALWRRLDTLCRGRAIHPDQLRDRLLLAPNARVKLDDPDWQQRLLELGLAVRPRAFIFDPLARMKDAAPGRERSDRHGAGDRVPARPPRRDAAPRRSSFTTPATRANTCGAPATSNPPGSPGSRSSATATAASSRSRPTTATRSPAGTLLYRLDWHPETRTIRLRPTVPPLADRIVEYSPSTARAAPRQSRRASRQGAPTSTGHSHQLEALGTTHRAPSGKRDALGRPITGRSGTSATKRSCASSRNPDATGRPIPGAVPPPRPVPIGTDGGRAIATDAPTEACELVPESSVRVSNSPREAGDLPDEDEVGKDRGEGQVARGRRRNRSGSAGRWCVSRALP